MPNALARPEQSQPPVSRFPLFAQSGREAAALWLAGAPLSMADFRDLRLRNLLAGLGHLDDLVARTEAFHDGYAKGIKQFLSRAAVNDAPVAVSAPIDPKLEGDTDAQQLQRTENVADYRAVNPREVVALEPLLARIQSMLMAVTGPTGVEVLTDMGDEAADHFLACIFDMVTDCRARVANLANGISDPM